VGIAYDFFQKVLKINSLDDKGMTIISSVNYSTGYDNAFFDGVQIIFGDGTSFKPLGRSLSVIIHELGHGVTQFVGPNLAYWSDSGALNEAFSDILGISGKHWNTQDTDPNFSNWLIGDEIVTPAFPGKAIRSFKNEHAYEGDNQPKFRINYIHTLDDSGGVHINSGIINYLFYRICINLKSPSYLDPLQLFWATHKKLWQHSNFDDFKKKLIATSAEMFSPDSSKHQVILSTLKEVKF
jgi:Zn-dependent metalloprotease